MIPTIVSGDLLDQEVEVIINAWNRNIIPWWLLLPQGVSGAIKRKGGIRPFREIARAGALPLGSAALTSAGKLPFKAIIHVAGINMFWCASVESISRSVRSAMTIINDQQFASAAFPIIGAGSGGFKQDEALDIMLEEMDKIASEATILVVKFDKRA